MYEKTSGITINLNKSTEEKHELTEAEIAKINFNKKGVSQIEEYTEETNDITDDTNTDAQG